MSDWREKMAVAISSMERRLAMKLQANHVHCLTQEPLCVTSADFYFPTSPRPLAVFLDGPPHLKERQRIKDEVFRGAVRLAGYRVLELPYSGDSMRTLDGLYKSIMDELASMGH